MTLTRAQWGARAPKEAPIRVSPASRTGTAIHHDGATPIVVRTLADVIALIRRDQAFHMDTRGWNDIGYNWLVISAPGYPAIDGLVVEGRGRDVVGAHCEGHNTEWAWNATGVVSLLVGLFWMLATGRIVTRRELDTRMSDKDEQIRNYREAAAISAVQTDSLASIGEMQVRLLKSIEELSKRRSGE